MSDKNMFSRIAVCSLLFACGGAFAQALDNAPTINTLSQLQRAEIERAIQKRNETLNPPPVAPVVVAPTVNPAFIAPPKIKPPVTKTVLAIYGRQGSEVAEFAMPDGSIIRASAGQQVADFKVLSVRKDSVLIQRPQESKTKAKSSKRSSAHKHRSGKANDSAKTAEPKFSTFELKTGTRFD